MAMTNSIQTCAEHLQGDAQRILETWNERLKQSAPDLVSVLGEMQVQKRCREFLDRFLAFLNEGGDLESDSYRAVRHMLSEFSKETTVRHLAPSDSARFIFALKDALLPHFQDQIGGPALARALPPVLQVLDTLGLYTLEAYVASREQIIKEQHTLLISISVPVIKVWDKIVLVPLIGMLDSSRTQLMMEVLLSAIEEKQSKVAIIDISGIPVVDTLVARHLITTVKATQLMGAECIVTGISARISQTMVQLGIDLSGIVTRSSLADGLRYAMEITGQPIP